MNETITKRLVIFGSRSITLRGCDADEEARGRRLAGHLLEEKKAPAAHEMSRLAEANIPFDNPRAGERG